MPSGFSASGSKARSEFLLDGIPNMSPYGVSLSPSPDAVEEMRLQTNTFDAEYGHTGGAFVNVSTKSGANQAHGALYWFLRNDNLNANSFFNNLSGLAKSESKLNTYGVALSGPAYLPKLYNGRDRTHYSFDFEGTRIRRAGMVRDMVPSQLERAGDFSRTTDRFGSPFSIYDPLSTRPDGSAWISSFPAPTLCSCATAGITASTPPIPTTARAAAPPATLLLAARTSSRGATSARAPATPG